MKDTKQYFSIRDVQPDDLSLIYSSWLRSYRDSYMAKHIANAEYFPGQHKIIESILNSPNTIVYIIHAPEDATQVLGYAVWEKTLQGPVIHWIYTKLSFRSFKLASTLYALITSNCPGQISYTHLPKLADKLLVGKPVKFNPYHVWSK